MNEQQSTELGEYVSALDKAISDALNTITHGHSGSDARRHLAADLRRVVEALDARGAAEREALRLAKQRSLFEGLK